MTSNGIECGNKCSPLRFSVSLSLIKSFTNCCDNSLFARNASISKVLTSSNYGCNWCADIDTAFGKALIFGMVCLLCVI